jgi:hypothetical protein
MNINHLKYSLGEDFNYYMTQRKGLNDDRFEKEKKILLDKLIELEKLPKDCVRKPLIQNEIVLLKKNFQEWIISDLK